MRSSVRSRPAPPVQAEWQARLGKQQSLGSNAYPVSTPGALSARAERPEAKRPDGRARRLRELSPEGANKNSKKSETPVGQCLMGWGLWPLRLLDSVKRMLTSTGGAGAGLSWGWPQGWRDERACTGAVRPCRGVADRLDGWSQGRSGRKPASISCLEVPIIAEGWSRDDV